MALFKIQVTPVPLLRPFDFTGVVAGSCDYRQCPGVLARAAARSRSGVGG